MLGNKSSQEEDAVFIHLAALNKSTQQVKHKLIEAQHQTVGFTIAKSTFIPKKWFQDQFQPDKREAVDMAVANLVHKKVCQLFDMNDGTVYLRFSPGQAEYEAADESDQKSVLAVYHAKCHVESQIATATRLEGEARESAKSNLKAGLSLDFASSQFLGFFVLAVRANVCGP